MVLLTVIIMDLLTGMEFDLFVPGFPQLQHYFGLTPFWVEALLSVNFIGYCFSLFFVGGLADRYGRKPIILLGLTIFTIGSILCLCTSSYLFICWPFFAGVGVVAADPQFLIIADSYSLKEQQFLMAMLNAIKCGSRYACQLLTLYLLRNFTALLILIDVISVTDFYSVLWCQQIKLFIAWIYSYISIYAAHAINHQFSDFVCALLDICWYVSFVIYKRFRRKLTHFGYYQALLLLYLRWEVWYLV